MEKFPEGIKIREAIFAGEGVAFDLEKSATADFYQTTAGSLTEFYGKDADAGDSLKLALFAAIGFALPYSQGNEIADFDGALALWADGVRLLAAQDQRDETGLAHEDDHCQPPNGIPGNMTG
jgi:hypothetical protein